MHGRKNQPDRKNVGAYSQELAVKPLDTRDPIELERAMQKDYLKNVIECIARSKSNFPDDFFVVVLTKRERLMQNVIRLYFVARQSCPTPNYEQAVFRYIAKDDKVEYIWTIPDRDTCFTYLTQALMVAPEERQLLNYILDFKSGELYKRAMMLNGEEIPLGVDNERPI